MRPEIWRFHDKEQTKFTSTFFNLLKDKTAVFPISAVEQRYLRGIHYLKGQKTRSSQSEDKFHPPSQVRRTNGLEANDTCSINIITLKDRKRLHGLLNK